MIIGYHGELSNATHDGSEVTNGYVLTFSSAKFWYFCAKFKQWNIWSLPENTDSQSDMSQSSVYHCTECVKSAMLYVSEAWPIQDNDVKSVEPIEILGWDGCALAL